MRIFVFLLAALWYDSSSYGHVHHIDYENSRVLPERSRRVTKRQEELGYLEQCSILQFWDKQIGRVNILAFFDSTWQFSHRQAAMLRVLKERFDRTGFENIQFFAINAEPGEAQYINRAEIEVEEETWKQISPSEAEGLPPVVVSPEALIESLGPDVYFIQDNEELQIWPKLRAFRDQILVIDRCGRLTYQVIVPWSILHFPYVKAAILSTYKDEPCGHCQFKEPSYDKTNTENYDASQSSDEFSTQLTEDLNRQSGTEESSASFSQSDNEKELTSSEEAYTSTVQNRNNFSIIEESSTPVNQNDSIQMSTKESPNPSEQTESDQSSYTSEESSTLPVRSVYDETSPTSEESSILLDQTESDQTSLSSGESSTIPIEIDTYDTSLNSEETTTTTPIIPTENTLLPTLEETTISPTESELNNTIPVLGESTTQTLEAETISTDSNSAYNSTAPNSNDYYDIVNSTDNEYADENVNVTETENNFEIVTEMTERNVDGTFTDNSESVTEIPENYDEISFEYTENSDLPNSTEYISENSTRMTDTTISNEELGELRLKDTSKDFESMTRDILKSRSTNARSVSPNDESENHLEVIEINSEPSSSEENQLESDFMIPIRIIMRAPHVDELSDRTMKAHEYLVLKTGQPNYHEHLESFEHDDIHKAIRKKSDPIKSTFGKDESPGLYGELADYWQNFGNDHTLESTESSIGDDDEQVLEQGTSFVEGGVTLRPSVASVSNYFDGSASATPGNKETDNEQIYDVNINSNEEVDVLDEEAKSKLIAHYSKLLPWLYYVLAK